MELFFYVFLGVFWLLFGSFASVIIYRLKSGEKGMWTGRSHCMSCNKILSAFDLAPVFSYLIHRGKCRQCKSSISAVYPLLEFTTAAIFMMMGYFLVDSSLILSGNGFELLKLFFFLMIGFCMVVFVFYDILFMEIPESILLLAVITTFVGISFDMLSSSFSFLPFVSDGAVSGMAFWSIAFSAFSIGLLYVIFLAEMKEIYDAMILVGIIAGLSAFVHFGGEEILSLGIFQALIGVLIIFIFFFLQIVISQGKWLWGWDLRIAILMGLLLWLGGVWYGLVITYIVGSIVGIGIIIYKKIKNKWQKVDTMIPFGPFLTVGTLVVLFCHEWVSSFVNYYL